MMPSNDFPMPDRPEPDRTVREGSVVHPVRAWLIGGVVVPAAGWSSRLSPPLPDAQNTDCTNCTQL